MHCHMELHNANGMSLYLKVGHAHQMPKIPLQLLKTDLFDLNMAEKKEDEEDKEEEEEEETTKNGGGD